MRIRRIQFKRVPLAELGGRRCRMTRTDDGLLWELSQDDSTPEVCDDLNATHIDIVEVGIWSGHVDQADGPWPAGTEPRKMPRAPRYEIVPEAMSRLLAGELFTTYEDEQGVAVGMIREGHFTEALRDDINEDLEDWFTDGLWVRWRGDSPEPGDD